MKKAIAILVMIPFFALGASFPTHSNTATVDVDQVTGNWNSFNWKWIGYNTQTNTITVKQGSSYVTLTGYNVFFKMARMTDTGQVTYVNETNLTVSLSNILFQLNYTNIPPNNTYLAEFYSDDGSAYRSFAQGKITVNSSIYGGDDSLFPFPVATNIDSFITVLNTHTAMTTTAHGGLASATTVTNLGTAIVALQTATNNMETISTNQGTSIVLLNTATNNLGTITTNLGTSVVLLNTATNNLATISTNLGTSIVDIQTRFVTNYQTAVTFSTVNADYLNQRSAGSIYSLTNIIPNYDNQLTLGDGTFRWKDIQSYTFTESGTALSSKYGAKSTVDYLSANAVTNSGTATLGVFGPEATQTNQYVNFQQLLDVVASLTMETFFGSTNNNVYGSSGALLTASEPNASIITNTISADGSTMVGRFWMTNYTDRVANGNYVMRWYTKKNSGNRTVTGSVRMLTRLGTGTIVTQFMTAASTEITTALEQKRLTGYSSNDVVGTEVAFGVEYWLTATGGSQNTPVLTYLGAPYDAHIESESGLGSTYLGTRGATNVVTAGGQYGTYYDSTQRVITLPSVLVTNAAAPTFSGLTMTGNGNGGGNSWTNLNSVTTTNKIGAGTLAPSFTLSVKGNAAIGNTYAIGSGVAANTLVVEGNIGVGTPIPDQRVQVAGAAAKMSIYDTSALAVGVGGELYLEGLNVTSSSNYPYASIKGYADSASSAGTLQLRAAKGGVLSNTVSIVGATSRMGVNNTNPSTTLDVNGAATIRGNLDIQGNLVTNTTSITFVTNTVKMTSGAYSGTNGVFFTIAGTNFWILLSE